MATSGGGRGSSRSAAPPPRPTASWLITDRQSQAWPDATSPRSPNAEAGEAWREQAAAAWSEIHSCYDLQHLIGDTPLMARVRRQVRLAASSSANVLLLGPAGSGREHIARTIHVQRRPGGVLFPLACPLLDAELLQASLMAARPDDAWSGASAGPAWLLLDVDELPRDAQQLLRQSLDPTHGLEILSTAKRDLSQLADEDRFDRELAYRLSTLTICIPPLSERVDDLPLLGQMLLEQINAAGGKQWSGLTLEALNLLALFPWSDNIDQLRSVLVESCRRAAGPKLQAGDLPHYVHMALVDYQNPSQEPQPIDLDQALADFERKHLEHALQCAQGNRAMAARLLCISRPRLLRRLEHFGID